MTLHPHALFLLSALKDAVVETTPEHPSLDLAASCIVAGELRSEASALLQRPGLSAVQLAELSQALTEFDAAADALDAACELHHVALRRLSAANIAAGAGLPAVDPSSESAPLSLFGASSGLVSAELNALGRV